MGKDQFLKDLIKEMEGMLDGNYIIKLSAVSKMDIGIVPIMLISDKRNGRLMSISYSDYLYECFQKDGKSIKGIAEEMVGQIAD